MAKAGVRFITIGKGKEPAGSADTVTTPCIETVLAYRNNSSTNDQAAKNNTDREIWREEADGYGARLFITEGGGGLGIDCDGLVIVFPISQWHELGREFLRSHISLYGAKSK